MRRHSSLVSPRCNNRCHASSRPCAHAHAGATAVSEELGSERGSTRALAAATTPRRRRDNSDARRVFSLAPTRRPNEGSCPADLAVAPSCPGSAGVRDRAAAPACVAEGYNSAPWRCAAATPACVRKASRRLASRHEAEVSSRTRFAPHRARGPRAARWLPCPCSRRTQRHRCLVNNNGRRLTSGEHEVRVSRPSPANSSWTARQCVAVSATEFIVER